jgi:hypothetical protein
VGETYTARSRGVKDPKLLAHPAGAMRLFSPNTSARAPSRTNTWRDTVRDNLACKYRNWTGRIACGSYSAQKIISMGAYGRPVEGVRITFADWEWHTLGVGQSWATGQPISCRSTTDGIRCQNTEGWFFLVMTSRIYVGRYGQYLYWL